jgi:hypothetical protein
MVYPKHHSSSEICPYMVKEPLIQSKPRGATAAGLSSIAPLRRKLPGRETAPLIVIPPTILLAHSFLNHMQCHLTFTIADAASRNH